MSWGSPGISIRMLPREYWDKDEEYLGTYSLYEKVRDSYMHHDGWSPANINGKSYYNKYISDYFIKKTEENVDFTKPEWNDFEL